jgi:hypothetical protein
MLAAFFAFTVGQNGVGVGLFQRGLLFFFSDILPNDRMLKNRKELSLWNPITRNSTPRRGNEKKTVRRRPSVNRSGQPKTPVLPVVT